MVSKDTQALIPRTGEHVTLQGKSDFADVIKFKGLEVGGGSWVFFMGSVYSHAFFKSGEPFPVVMRKGGVKELDLPCRH